MSNTGFYPVYTDFIVNVYPNGLPLQRSVLFAKHRLKLNDELEFIFSIWNYL